MVRETTVTLLSTKYKTDSLSQQIPVESRREVFCRKHSVTQSEFHAAGLYGLRPQYKLTLFCGDYGGEELVELEGVRYRVYRTYLAKHDRMELYLRKE